MSPSSANATVKRTVNFLDTIILSAEKTIFFYDGSGVANFFIFTRLAPERCNFTR